MNHTAYPPPSMDPAVFLRMVQVMLAGDPSLRLRLRSESPEDGSDERTGKGNGLKSPSLAVKAPSYKLEPLQAVFDWARSLVKVEPLRSSRGYHPIDRRRLPRGLDSLAAAFQSVFWDNPAYRRTLWSEDHDKVYLEFHSIPCQYYDGNTEDPDGIRTVLFEQLVREVFPYASSRGIHFCTEVDSCIRLSKDDPESCLDDSRFIPGMS